MRELDEKEVKIIRELIRNPRASDNMIARKTDIPVMTVNRKRKALEEKNMIRYYISLDKRHPELRIFEAKGLYIIKFKIGITRKQYVETLEEDPNWRMFNSRFISSAYLGDKDGHLALIITLDAVTKDRLTEEFNGKIVPFLKEKLGSDCIKEVITASIDKTVRTHHNYLPAMNMRNGVVKKEWPNEYIFINETGDEDEAA